MAKYHYPSRYWADDKDVSDLISQPRFTSRKLQQIAKRRGIIVSEGLSKEAIVEYLSTLPFSWADLIGFLEEIESELRDPSTTSTELERDVDIPAIENAVRAVRDGRGNTRQETFEITTAQNTVNVTIRYQELNPQVTRMLQWTDQRAEIQICKLEHGVKIRHAATERATEIAKAIQEALQPTEGPAAAVHEISLEHITDNEKRTDFFRKIILHLDGLRPENVMDVRLNKMSVDEQGNTRIETEEMSLDEGAAEETEEAANVGSVKKTVLSGDSLLQAPEFHDFIKKGFFISKAIWTAIEATGNGRKFEFEAEFKNPEKATNFTYKPRGCWERDEDGNLVLKKTDPKLDDRRILIEKLEKAAKQALAEISAPTEESTASEPAVAEVAPANAQEETITAAVDSVKESAERIEPTKSNSVPAGTTPEPEEAGNR